MSSANLFNDQLNNAITALFKREYYAAYPENPKAYAEGADAEGKTAFSKMMNTDFSELLQAGSNTRVGDEVSPYLQTGIGIKYPYFETETLIMHAKKAHQQWKKTDINTRAAILIETLERFKTRFFEVAYATMHTTGQSFMMSFQASGPHAADRAMEAIAMGVVEQTRFPGAVEWKKNMGKFDLTLNKTWRTIPKGIGLVIGCSTFPTWNSVPGLYADLITGNVAIVKPHPKAILPMAILVAEIQKVLKEKGYDPHICQLAADSSADPITKKLAEHPDVKLIDYTGSTAFGMYIESIKNKEVFTENAGVNSVILDSANDLKAVMQNIAFSACLYSGQMCTAPQNIFISKDGINTAEGNVPFDEAAQLLVQAVQGLVNNPKAGAPTLGTIQNENTLKRAQNAGALGGKLLLESGSIKNDEFEHARIASPAILEVNASDKKIFQCEAFGPIVMIVKTSGLDESLALAKETAANHGSITCLAYSTSEENKNKIADEMNEAFTPVSFNFTGAAFVNQHAGFSDFHVTGGNPSGNASFTNPEYITKRFVWVGNRSMA